jgi:hypothetical protein
VAEVGTGVAVALIVLWLGYAALHRRLLINPGYGITALDSLDFGERDVDAKIVRMADPTLYWAADRVAETADTVVTVGHKASVPCVIEYRGGEAGAINADSLTGLMSKPPRSKVPAVSLQQLGFVQGVIQIGPDHIRFVERGELLEPGYLRAVVLELVAIGESAERTSPNDATPL